MTETQTMTYDDYGRETATSSSQYSASTAKTYNDRGQLATEATTYSGQTYTVSYTYDSQGRPIKLTYPSGREAEYTYDDRQLLKTIKWETAQIEDRSYNDAGMLTGVDRAYVDETRTYNAGSQLTQIDNTSVGAQTYTYDLNGNVTSETLSGVMANYSFSTLHSGSPYADGYDAEDRFMRFKRSGVSEDILLTRSDIGNISNVNRNGTNTARGYNTSHGLTTVTGGTTQTYDTDGNTTKLHTNVTAAWDDAGRMKNTDVPSAASAGIEGLNENGYVGGTRIWKKITRNGKGGPSVVEHRVHIHAGPNLIAEYNAGVAASTPVQEYVYAGEIDSLVLIRRSDATKYGVTRNRQWSITALHDLANGNVVERYAYELTGKRTIYAANGTTVRTTSSYGNNFGYTNRWHDEDSGLMYFRARYYNPLTGEFLSRDPMEFIDGMSLYRGYMAISNVDPSGTLLVRYKAVAKSFINGVDPIGVITPDRAGITPFSWIIKRFFTPAHETATDRLRIAAQFFKQLKAFNQNPDHDRKDGRYRLYTLVDLDVDCVGGAIVIFLKTTDMDPGLESEEWMHDWGLPRVTGTINMTPPTITTIGGWGQVYWTGWGHPHITAEPGMQAIAMRTSVNIWHRPVLEFECRTLCFPWAEFPVLTVAGLSGSKFPSHRLWVNGLEADNVDQNELADLWNPHPGKPTWVE